MTFTANIYTSLPWNNYYGFFGFIWYILLACGLFQTFRKAGEEGWKAIIPIYNLYICFKIANKESMFWLWGGSLLLSGLFAWMSNLAIFFLLGAVSTIFSLIAALLLADMWYGISVNFGHGFGFALGLIFLNPLFIIILGFGDSQYRSFYHRY
ncbi:DUF5684 domain-containing protein [Ileibacterium valens]|uniref:DUF5684 domain-containing protein n=1 Tax=Ileibacterium valens TaxID=1862668 RepID=UPI0024BA6E56|nr:DUF5684 domain-containing protein [Ileibacterium valens]